MLTSRPIASRTLLLASAATLAACGAETVAQQPATRTPSTQILAVTPTPVTPASATLNVVAAFQKTQDTYGDPIENLNIDLTTNIPVVLDAEISMFRPGDSVGQLCDPLNCIVEGGHLSVRWFWKNAAPSGAYRIEVLIPSWSGFIPDTVLPVYQDHRYQDWVGQLGANLKGNPLAIADHYHPAILDLKTTLALSHP